MATSAENTTAVNSKTIDHGIYHGLVKWTVKNICYANGFLIESPVFTLGKTSKTQWFLILTLNTTGDRITTYFQRLQNDEGPDMVGVTYRFCHQVDGEHFWTKETSHPFAKGSNITVALDNTSRSTENVLEVAFQVFLWNMPAGCEKNVFEAANERLLEDYRILISTLCNFDVVLRTEDRNLLAHKAVVSARSLLFRETLGPETEEVNLTSSNTFTLIQVLIYMYYMSSALLLRYPLSNRLYDYAISFKIEDLKLLLTPTIFQVTTEITRESAECSWFVQGPNKHFSGQTGHVQSPVFTTESGDACYLQVHPQGLDNSECGLQIRLQMLNLSKHAVVRMEDNLSVTDGKGRELQNKSTRVDSEVQFGSETVFSGGASAVEDGFLVRSCVEVTSLKLIEYFETLESLKPSTHTNSPSPGFEWLRESGTYSDLLLESCGKTFRAHKIILLLKAPLFFNNVTKKSVNTNEVVQISDIDPVVLSLLLDHCYSFTRFNFGIEIATSLYIVAQTYSVRQLAQLCSDYILSILDVKIICDVLCLADKYRDVNFLDHSVRWLGLHFDEIEGSNGWKYLKRTKKRLVVDIMDFISKVCSFSG